MRFFYNTIYGGEFFLIHTVKMDGQQLYFSLLKTKKNYYLWSYPRCRNVWEFLLKNPTKIRHYFLRVVSQHFSALKLFKMNNDH